MSEDEITLARAYLAAAGNDPVAALIRSVRDLADARRRHAVTASTERAPAAGSHLRLVARAA